MKHGRPVLASLTAYYIPYIVFTVNLHIKMSYKGLVQFYRRFKDVTAMKIYFILLFTYVHPFKIRQRVPIDFVKVCLPLSVFYYGA